MVSASSSTGSSPTSPELSRARSKYRYLPEDQNEMAPICISQSWPWREEQYGPSWILPFLPNYLAAQGRHLVQRIRCAFQRATFRFDQLEAYQQLLRGSLPPFARDFEQLGDAEHDAAFAWWRIAGANSMGLRREDDLSRLCGRLRLPIDRIEKRLAGLAGRAISLEEETREGRLFVVDYPLILKAIQWQKQDARRDSRWSKKYLPAPIGVFLAMPDQPAGLVPLAIQIDAFEKEGDYNPVYTPDDGWRWRTAKAYFEAADVTWQAGFGHIFSSHLVMEPFCMATPRQLPPEHPVRLLLQPHTRFTLTTNQAGYKYLIDRSKLYNEVYTASLEQLREVAIQGYLERGFMDLGLEADLARRGVEKAPVAYPYRDDMSLWLGPIGEFVRSYVEAFYADDAEVVHDSRLQAWKEELTDHRQGAVRQLVPGDRLDSRQKLIDLLAQVLFTAGPGHASQHYSADYFYRYAPAFPGGAYVPPPLEGESVDFARWLRMLPPINVASDQFRSNTFTNFQYDRFGRYDRFPLGDLEEAREPIARLQAALSEVEQTIDGRQADRLYGYEFVRPSRVPNSINI